MMRYSDFIEVGYYRSDIAQKISSLMDKASFRYKLYSRLNELGEFKNKNHIKESRKDFAELITEAIKEINESINTYNESASIIFSSKIKKILIGPVRTEINRILKHIETDEKGYNLVAPYIGKDFHEFLIKTVDPVFLDLIKHKNEYSEFIKSFRIGSCPEPYRSDLQQMLDVYLMDYKSTALLVLGRIFEKIFTAWGLILIENGKLDKTKSELNDLKFENTLGIFKSKGWITEKEWLLLSKLRLDRNVGGHYLSDKDALVRKETEQEAEMTIKLAIPLLSRFDQKISKEKSRP